MKLNQITEFPIFDEVLNYKIKLAINILSTRLVKLSKSVTKDVKRQIPKYYADFKLIVDKPFVFHMDSNTFKSHTMKLIKVYNSTHLVSEFKERFSDSCLGLMMTDNKEKACASDSQCFEYFLQEDASGRI